jgi:hypothetical protein
MTVRTLNDARVLVERHLTAESRVKEMWRYVSSELGEAARGNDLAKFSSVLQMALSLEGLEWSLEWHSAASRSRGRLMPKGCFLFRDANVAARRRSWALPAAAVRRPAMIGPAHGIRFQRRWWHTTAKRILLNALLKGLADAVRRDDRSAAERYCERFRLATDETVADEPVQNVRKELLLISGLWVEADAVNRDETRLQMLEFIDRVIGLLTSVGKATADEA